MHPVYTSAIIDRITQLSPSARRAYETENYRYQFETDAVDEKSVGDHLLTALVQDLYDIGVEFTLPIGELSQSGYQLNQFLDLVSYIFPTTLTQILTVYPSLYGQIEAIVNGDVVDAYDDPTILTYLKFIGCGDQPLVEDLHMICSELLPHATSRESFNTYIRTVLEYHTTSAHPQPIDLSHIKSAYQLIDSISSRLDQLFKALKEMDATYKYLSVISNKIARYKQLFTNPDVVDLVTWYYLKSDHIMSLSEKTLRLKSYQEFCADSDMYPDYSFAHKKAIGELSLVSYLLRIAATSLSSTHFMQGVQQLDRQLADHHITVDPVIQQRLLTYQQLFIDVLYPPASDTETRDGRVVH